MECQSGLQIKLFGQFQAYMNGQPIAGLRLRDGERLLAYLALNNGKAITYRSLSEIFWPAESRSAKGIHGDFPCTRQGLRALRMALGTQSGLLESAGKGLACLRLADCNLDTMAFERLAASPDLAEKRLAIDLYSGPLLADWNDTWAQNFRVDYANGFVQLLEKLIDRARRMGDLEELETLLQKAAENDPCNDKWARESSELRKRRNAGSRTHPFAGGAVPLESRYYLARPVDAELHDAIARGDSIVLIKGARQMGKSSLLARQLDRAREGGAKVVFSDIEAISEEHMVTADSFLSGIAASLIEQLDLDIPLKRCWNPDMDANLNFERFIRKFILAEFDGHFVMAMDGVDRLFRYPFGAGTFALFRSWHNNRAMDPSGPWSRFTLAIAYASEAHLFITDLNQSPFNVGTRLALSDFSNAEVAELNRRYGKPLVSDDEVARFYRLINGHPYLVNRGLQEMAARSIPYADLERQAEWDDGPFGDHLRGMLATLQRDASALEAVRRILQGETCPGLEWLYRLRSGGIMKGDSVEDATIRCKLYESYLGKRLL